MGLEQAMKIQLTAMGETSALTEGKKLSRGAVLDVTKAKAAEAVKTGRWKAVAEEREPGNEGGAGD